MKLKFVLFLVIGLLPVFSFAQGCITIYSEDGDKFFLYINGVQQNQAAQANVRVDGLMGDNYSARIVFEDQGKPPISKTVMNTKDISGNYQESTFKIKNKDGELKLRFTGVSPMPANYNPPPGMYYSHYGQAPDATVTQTTVTTNNNPGNGGASISIGAPGVNMNINVSDPNINGGVSQTTTTTSSYSQSSTPPPAPAGCQYPMEWNTFKTAKQTIAQASFEDTKLSTAKSVLGANCMSTDQVVDICKLFTFEETKLKFAKFAYSKTTDPGNYFKVNNVFTFDASKTELNNFVANGGR